MNNHDPEKELELTDEEWRAGRQSERRYNTHMIDPDLKDDIRDVLATHGAGSYRRQAGAKMRDLLTSPGVVIVTWGAAILYFIGLVVAIVGSIAGSSQSTQSPPEIRSESTAAATPEPEPDMTLLQRLRVGTLVTTSGFYRGTVIARGDYTVIRWDDNQTISYTDHNLAEMLNTGSIAIR
jgi:hypothetical protein